MKTPVRSWIAALALTTTWLLGGCATQWARPDTSFEQLTIDLEACEAKALEAFPVLMTASAPDYRVQSSVSCSGTPGTENCRAKPGAYTQEGPKDVNKTARLRAVSDCMEAAGYEQR